jgi:Tfp pilus assembly protein PilO
MSNSDSGRFSWPVAVTLVVLIIVGATVLIFWRLETWPARAIGQSAEELERLGKDLRAAFIDVAHLQPRIKINDRTIINEAMPTAELAVLERQLKVKREFQHSWAGSSKRIKLTGTFLIKAGFDLRQDVAVDVRPDEILVHLPHAIIVGVEENHVDVLALENGLWNRITGADLENELAQLPEMARRQALETGLPAEAEQELQRQLDKRIHSRQPLKLVFTGAPSTESPFTNR